MPREAKGELRKLATGWEARVTIQGRERLGLELPFSHAEESEANERCGLLANLAQRLRKAGQVADAPALLKMAAIATTAAKLDGVLRAVEALCTVGATVVDKKGGPDFQGARPVLDVARSAQEVARLHQEEAHRRRR
jgi:hypothetical protein